MAETADLAQERVDLLDRFLTELSKPTGDGSKKRRAGTKPPWYRDDSHMAAVFSHFMKHERGELVDPDSGAHPFVHAAWRLLAIACIETGNVPLSEGPVTPPETDAPTPSRGLDATVLQPGAPDPGKS